MKKLAHKQEIAQWYAEQIMNHWQCPYDEIEWLVMNLKEDAMLSVADAFNERNYGK